MRFSMKKHIGSTIALVVGGLLVGSALAQHDNSAAGPFVTGLVMIPGALAYRSAKKRWLGEAKSSPGRWVAEATAMAMVVLLVVLQKEPMPYLLATNPMANFMVPVWAIVAYLIAILRPKPK